MSKLDQAPDKQSGAGVKFVLYLAALASVLLAMTIVAYQLWREIVNGGAQQPALPPVQSSTERAMEDPRPTLFTHQDTQVVAPDKRAQLRTLRMKVGRAAIEFEVWDQPSVADGGALPEGGGLMATEFQGALLRREELSRLSRESFAELEESDSGRIVLQKLGRLFWYGKKVERQASLQALLMHLHPSVRRALTDNPELNPGER